MADSQSSDPVSRRRALQVLAGWAGGAATFPIVCPALASRPGCLNPHAEASANWGSSAPKFFSPHQMRTIAALSEIIIPADEHSPGATAARVDTYIDAVMAGSAQDLKSFWVQGLAAIDRMAASEQGKDFADCNLDEQTALLHKISENEAHPITLEDKFFVAIKRATIDGYYNSEIGIHKELGYQGNTALAEFEGCTHQEHKTDAKAEGGRTLIRRPATEESKKSATS